MPETRRSAGVLFYDTHTQRVLAYRRDNTPTIPLPGYLDILGGHTEAGETPAQTAVREIAEELEDLRSSCPFVLTGHRLFTIYTDARGVTDYVFCKAVDFDLADVCLTGGQELVWLTEDEARCNPLTFGYNQILAAFFQPLRTGTVEAWRTRCRGALSRRWRAEAQADADRGVREVLAAAERVRVCVEEPLV